MTTSEFDSRRTVRALLFLVALIIGCAQNLEARDAFVMLSGGHLPMDNNYSQYLQARAVATYFERNYPKDSVWTFFGAGNVEGEKPVLGDVRRKVTRDGMALDTWLPGALNRNRPARREIFLRAMREEILPAVAGGGTLYLFVGDHGSQGGTNNESVIDLWGLESDPRNERGWRATRNESLSVTELRELLAKGLGKGRVVFCMTQCHSGGFHFLAMPREMTPDPRWFKRVPTWAAARKEETVFPRVAGFTATDERSLAAGCLADPDPQSWVGYEKLMPEHLLGMNLFNLERTGPGLRSFADAHVAATLTDRTIDKPGATSEEYLERGAHLIETRLANETAVTDKVKALVAAYQRGVDGKPGKISDPAWKERQTLYRRFTESLFEQNLAMKDLLLTGTREDLEKAIRARNGGRGSQASTPNEPPAPTAQTRQPVTPEQDAPQRPARPGGRRGGNGSAETMKLCTNTVRPAWKLAVESDSVPKVLGLAASFEKRLLSLEAKGRDYFSSGASDVLADEAYWRSGYATPQAIDEAKAEAVIRWGETRRSAILAWAGKSEDAAVRVAAERIMQLSPRRGGPMTMQGPSVPVGQVVESSPQSRPISRRIAAERTLHYRRVLAAWKFLLAVNHRPALARLHELTELERTPLPPAALLKTAIQ